MEGLGFTNFARFEGTWFYLCLIQRVMKSLIEERKEAILQEANDAERACGI